MPDKMSLSNNPAEHSAPAAQPNRKYQGALTSKEAGDMVKHMIREQEKVLLEEYEKESPSASQPQTNRW